MARHSLDPGVEMLGDDIFDGWLTMASLGSFLREEPPIPLQESLRESITESPQPSNDVSTESTEIATVRKRRGHTKSRLGCITCKRRKIKCQEQWPSCANCIKRGCPCRYPTVFKHAQHDRIVSEVIKNPRSLVRLSDTPTMYSANDMRLFHHFLVAAHPCIPHEYEVVWVRDVPAFSHQYDYLMHAILALAGSHLSVFLDDAAGSMALSHRQRAITGLEEAFSRWPPKAEEAHVMLACSYLLAFQSGFMPDGLFDHIISLRGCALMSQMILSNRLEGTFSVDPNMQNGFLDTKLINFPSLDQELARQALRSLADFLHLLDRPDARDIERALYSQLVGTVHPLLTPSNGDLSLSMDSVPTPDLTETTATPTTSSAGSPFAVPSLRNVIKNPLFPDEPSNSYEEIKSWGQQGIASCPPGHKTNPTKSFNALMSSLLILATWPQDEVIHLLSPSNMLGSVIMSHFFACRFIVSPLSAPESAMRTPIKAMVEWGEKTLDAIEDDEDVKWTQFVQWPRLIVKTLRCCLNQKRALTFGDVYDILIKDPAAFREGRMRRL